MRGDIADIRLADRVFAPHYAKPVPRIVARNAVLRADRVAGAVAIASMQPGETFELLDITSGVAWGVATAHGLVGYLDADSLDPAGPVR